MDTNDTTPSRPTGPVVLHESCSFYLIKLEPASWDRVYGIPSRQWDGSRQSWVFPDDHRQWPELPLARQMTIEAFRRNEAGEIDGDLLYPAEATHNAVWLERCRNHEAQSNQPSTMPQPIPHDSIRPLTVGERVQILPQWQDPGDDEYECTVSHSFDTLLYDSHRLDQETLRRLTAVHPGECIVILERHPESRLRQSLRALHGDLNPNVAQTLATILSPGG